MGKLGRFLSQLDGFVDGATLAFDSATGRDQFAARIAGPLRFAMAPILWRLAISKPSSSAPLIYLVAGEHSGDNLAGRLMAALKKRARGKVQFTGVGGPAMEAQGLTSLYPLSDLAVMGFAEIIPHLPRLIRRLRETSADIVAKQPDLVVTVDSPGFSLRLAQRLRGSGISAIHYVAPQLWAWSPGRGRKLSSLFDHVMALLPFEPEFFTRYDVDCTYVGHPVLESGADRGDGKAFRAGHALPSDATLISVLPGSRSTEINRLLPVFGAGLAMVAAERDNVTAVIATVDAVRETVAAATKDWPFSTIVVTDPPEKFDAFAASDVALTKSGTITLELALARLPMVVCYRVSRLTAFLARRLISVTNVALVNLMAGRQIVPELLQDDCTPEHVRDEILNLLDDKAGRAEQIKGFDEVVKRLGKPTPKPSERAADFLLQWLKQNRKTKAAAKG